MPRVSIPTNGAAIRRYRQMAGWDSKPFADRVGITPNYLSRLEGGHRQASPSTLKRIADALEVQMADLVGDLSPPRSVA